MTYQVAVRRRLIAQHYLIGGDWGKENELHSHQYVVEIQVEGEQLDQHGYLVDIVAVEAGLEEIVEYFSDRTLNDLPEFSGLNPSIEHFARSICQRIGARMAESGASAVVTKIWETEDAWAAYRLAL
jgi:6-pyruvoyltetrahydropterin/6-carboxytetrahydropterin synthase